MARRKVPNSPATPDWYIQEWLDFFRMKDAELGRLCGWGKGTVHNVVRGETDYYRAILNEVATALNLAPYELLMHPDEAMHIRRLRSSVHEEGRLRAAEQHSEFRGEADGGRRKAG